MKRYQCSAEYTNAHFRRQLVMFMLWYKKYFYSLLKQSIMGIYGHKWFTEEQLETLEKENLITEEQKKDQKMPGPHSFYSYLKDLLKPSTWGDENSHSNKHDVANKTNSIERRNFEARKNKTH